ncbi:MAG: anhydro-N-acetylmuramic acid kinase [Deltaproteobacteria bacterium GWA2_38_16]|nr:MAG: anhydro-N-acetylmuramic acid kinase [Deltaproteobacteria bacterium GWA2_38_16]OGQ01706.1 MAG: anhydro-N-acetylmuramic acid kinase [Deltaproteobacteria bacterium RIFCSPHIGHO2_02_FULL_38_15]OGQ34833.1 MAG: anhydro-N-acetylmuramic acid kinase [Deltaproteobacteria bacterium RIFCSPLOWO2_01_FULL_38_9]OGQ61214.1 MAG: anhydro-N-acetylmuramic acid kinase [Deltaproteobacteria bacterium RIFCSPLOWO2_12_FULL_38_8]
MKVIGLMSGTSADGIGVALVDIHGKTQISLLAFKTYPFSTELKKMILLASSHEKLAVDEICRLNFLLGEEFSKATLRLCKEAKVSLKDIALIGSHGQTIKHLPPKSTKPIQFGSTLQIGEPSLISERTGITTIADFRPRDMAAGGHGAPLAPYLHYHLFHSLGYGVAVQNIGGISNLTFIPKNGKLNQVIAFDTGPGNMLIDAIVFELTHKKSSYDDEGRWAARGKVNKRLLGRLMQHPFLKRKPPKSTGREEFGIFFAHQLMRENKNMKKEDLIATITAFTAHSIAESYGRFIMPKFSLKEIIVGGGGVKNKTLFSMVQRLLPSIQLKRFEDFSLNSDAIEAMAFALLAHETMKNVPSNIPNVTGARHAVLLGKIIPGNNFKKLLLSFKS